MKGIRDWVFTQVPSKSLASSRTLSGSGDSFPPARWIPPLESSDQGSSHATTTVALLVPFGTSCSSDSIHDDPYTSQQQILVEDSNLLDNSPNRKKMDRLDKIKNLQIKFLHIL